MTSAAQRIRVLVADDHPMYRDSVGRVVGAHPGLMLVATCEEGHAALAAIRELRPDVAVVDLRMPGLDGTAIIDAVTREGLQTRVILLSGHLDREGRRQALASGAAGVLSKLANGATVTDSILAVAAGERVMLAEAPARAAGELVLSDRQRDVLRLIADGHSVPSIAEQLHLSQSTIKTHLAHLYRKLAVSDRAAAVAEAMRRGILH